MLVVDIGGRLPLINIYGCRGIGNRNILKVVMVELVVWLINNYWKLMNRFCVVIVLILPIAIDMVHEVADDF